MTKFMNYLFYDTEGTGTNTRFDRVQQFAAIRTDSDLRRIEDINIRGRLPSHVIPHPMALWVTQTDPFDIDTAELTALDFVRAMHQFMSKNRPTCFVGQNILNYDEEICRSNYYMSLLDPYVTSGGGSMRVDMLPMLRLMYTLDPGFIEVAQTESGNVSFKLDRIAPLNGFEQHKAHDALGDVEATIYMFDLLKTRRPDLFALAMDQCQPAMVHERLSQGACSLLTYFGVPRWHRVVKVAQNPTNPKQVATFDLGCDPTPWLDLSPQEILAKMFAKTPVGEEESPTTSPVERPIRFLSTNKQPGIVGDAALESCGIDPASVVYERSESMTVMNERAALLANHTGFQTRMTQAMDLRFKDQEPPAFVESSIYSSGFASYQDKKRMEDFHRAASWERRAEIVRSFDKLELRKIGTGLVFEYAPELLSDAVRRGMQQAIRQRRLYAEGDLPWTTIPAAFAALDSLPEGALRDRIHAWLVARDQQFQS